ncbi:hypothetical protein GGE45_003943 [Rhizobium aethiopicum]|uniref:hypothetical protein n=1 Tax=Rhizobium aethiopicum TaxID=1138170 RepID=UPI00161BA344|nr:hypothetical protein [Rhizobium aethiopicum]MBB4581595.1 hypothetical protein [Rhizobium aethiopicum]
MQITEVWRGVLELLARFIGLNLCLDCKNEEAGPFIAALSHRADVRDASIVHFYTHGYDNGKELVDEVSACGPAGDWKTNTKFMACVQVEGLVKRQFKNALPHSDHRQAFELVLKATKSWIDSFIVQGINLWGVMLPFSEIGARYDVEKGTATDSAGMPVTDRQVWMQYFYDRILMELHGYVDTEYPHLVLATVVRAYDVCDNGVPCKWGPHSGAPAPWGKLHEFHQGMAEIGRARTSKYRFDLIVSDLLPSSLAYEAWLGKGVKKPLVWHNPSANLRPA